MTASHTPSIESCRLRNWSRYFVTEIGRTAACCTICMIQALVNIQEQLRRHVAWVVAADYSKSVAADFSSLGARHAAFFAMGSQPSVPRNTRR